MTTDGRRTADLPSAAATKAHEIPVNDAGASRRVTGGALAALQPWAWVTGKYYTQVCLPGFGNAQLANGDLYVVPLLVPAAYAVDRIACAVTTGGSAGAVIRLGIYADASGQPGALLVDAGTVAATTTGGKQITIAKTLSAGLWWLALVCQGAPVTTPTLAGSYADALGIGGFDAADDLIGSAGARYGTSITGALADPWAGGSITSFSPRIGVRCA